MTFKVIKGTLHVKGYRPDGDSIRFQAERESDWQSIRGRPVKLNRKNHAQLRIEAIDTLETHYAGHHQPNVLAEAATRSLLSNLGINNVTWNNKGVITAADDGVKAYVVTRNTDRFGRPISFLFTSSSVVARKKEIFLDKKNIRQSINYKLLVQGMAYPTFYDGLFYDLREVFAMAAMTARRGRVGVWSTDATNRFIEINGLEAIEQRWVIMPKVFRRLTEYFKQHERFDAHAFIDFLAAKKENVLQMRFLHFTQLHHLFAVNAAGKIKLTEKPEEIIFLS